MLLSIPSGVLRKLCGSNAAGGAARDVAGGDLAQVSGSFQGNKAQMEAAVACHSVTSHIKPTNFQIGAPSLYLEIPSI